MLAKLAGWRCKQRAARAALMNQLLNGEIAGPRACYDTFPCLVAYPLEVLNFGKTPSVSRRSIILAFDASCQVYYLKILPVVYSY